MSYQIKVIEDVADGDLPVTVPMQKAWSRIDADYAETDPQLLAQIRAGMELLEQQINIGMAVRTLELQWDGRSIELPFSPTVEILEVKRGDTVLVDGTDYYIDKAQAVTIRVKGCGFEPGNWFYSTIYGTAEFRPLISEYGDREIYTCRYKTGYGSEDQALPQSLKNAIMTQVDYTEKNRGMPDNSIVSVEALRLANKYSRNLVL